jgi:hypothetical protein
MSITGRGFVSGGGALGSDSPGNPLEGVHADHEQLVRVAYGESGGCISVISTGGFTTPLGTVNHPAAFRNMPAEQS